MRTKSSAAKESNARVTLNDIPPLTSQQQIETIMTNIISFFQQDIDIVILELPEEPQYFSSTPEPDYIPTEDESRNITTYTKKGKKSMFQYLASHPDLCRVAVKQIPWSHFKSNKRKNFYYQLLQIAFYADSLNLYKLTIVDTNSPPPKSSRKNHAVPLLQFVENPNRIPGLYVDTAFNTTSFEHTLDYIPTATAFAASPTELFVGKEGGFIRTISLTSTSKIYPHYCLFRPSVSNEAYSLAWIKGYLWILTNTTIYQVNTLISKVWTFVNNKPKDLIPPMCTDGHFFYCLRIRNRTPEIHIFSFNGTDFIHERHIKCNYQIVFQSEHKVIFATDGGLISFLIPKGKEFVFRIFSLANGKWLYDKPADSTLSQAICWCTKPFTNESVIITPKTILFYSKQIQIPRWLLGLPWPKLNSSDAIMNALEMACFHGVNFFKTGPYDEIGPLLSHFINTNNEVGFRLVSMILLREHLDNIKPILQIIADYYTRCETNPIMQRFCCFIFLACSNETTHSVKPNILSMYLEKDNTDLDFIFLYPKGFNFKNTSLSETAIKKLIVYVAERWNDFPIEASYIILNFLQDYCSLMVRKDSYDSILEPISAIFRVISKAVSLIFKNKINPDTFYNSSQFTAWDFLLKAIMLNRNSWPRYSHILVKMLKLGFMSQETEQKNCDKIKDMMNKTLFLLLQILLKSPMKLFDVEFQSIEEFNRLYHHPMNMQYTPIDNAVLNTLNKAYDISTPDEYADYFFKVRRTIVFDYGGDSRILTDLKLKSLSAKGVLEYLIGGKSEKSQDKKLLYPIQDSTLLHWFFNEFSKSYNHLTIEQNVILSLFFVQFQKKLNKYCCNNIVDKEVWDLKSHLVFPYMLPPALLNQMDVHIPEHSIKKLDPNILGFSFDTIVSIYNKIDKKDHFLKPILKHLPPNTMKPNYSHFSSIETESRRYKSILLWLILATNGYDINYSNYSDAFKIYIWSGSPRIVEAVMKGVLIAESKKNSNLHVLFDFIISLIKNYIYRLRNFFLLQSDPTDSLISLFVIIEYLKKMFVSKSGLFRGYLENVAKKCKRSKAVAIFAILNNYLEVVRKGVKIHFYSGDMIEVDGIVEDYYSNTVLVDGIQYDLSTCTKIWCKSQEKVDFPSDVNLKTFENLFKNTEYVEGKEDHLNVFKYASLITFLKHKKFYKLLSHHLKKHFTSLPIYHSFEPETVLSDFFLFLSFNTRLSKFSSFSFVDFEEKKIENPISPALQTFLSSNKTPNMTDEKGVINDDENNDDEVIEGMLMTMEKAGNFVSSPIHRLCHLKVTFFLLPSEPNKQKPSISIVVHGISRTNSMALKSEPIDIKSDPDNSVLIEIEFNPSSSTFSVFIDEELENETAISPAISSLYMTINLLPSSLVEYKITYDNKIKDIDEFPKCFNLKNSKVKLMTIANPPVPLPLSESSIYNQFCFKESSKYLVDCFTQLVKMQIIHISSCSAKSKSNKDKGNENEDKKSKKKRRKNQEGEKETKSKKKKNKNKEEDKEKETYKMKPILLMHVLAMCNSFPNDETLDFAELRKTNLFHNLGHDSNSFVNTFITDKCDEINLTKYVSAVEQLTKPFTKRIVSTTNNSAFFLKSEDPFTLYNCYLFCESQPPKNVGLRGETFDLKKPIAVIPHSNFHGTIIDALLYIRHLIALFVLKDNYDFSPIRDLIDKMTKRNESSLKPLFVPLLELMTLLAPSPKSINVASFLIKESSIYKEKDVHAFLNEFMPSVAPNNLEPQKYTLTLPASIYLPNADLVYLTVTTKSKKCHELVIEKVCSSSSSKPIKMQNPSPSTPLPSVSTSSQMRSLSPAPRPNGSSSSRNSSSLYVSRKTHRLAKTNISYISSFIDKKDRSEKSENTKKKKGKNKDKDKEKSDSDDSDNYYNDSDSQNDTKQKGHKRSKREKSDRKIRKLKNEKSDRSYNSVNNDFAENSDNSDDNDTESSLHITTDDGSFHLIGYNNIKIKSPTDAHEEIEIHVYAIDLESIPKNLDNWRPNHSHQILCSIAKGQQLTEEVYSLMPLSTIFSYQVASFILSVIRNGKSSLFRFNSHLIYANSQDSRFSFNMSEKSAMRATVMAIPTQLSAMQMGSLAKTRMNTLDNIVSLSPNSFNNIRAMNGQIQTQNQNQNQNQSQPINAHTCSNDSNESSIRSNGSLGSKEIASMADVIHDDNDNSPLYFSFCTKITEKENQSWQRVFYLRENNLSLIDNLDPDLIRILPEFSQYPMGIRMIKQQLEKNLKFTKSSKAVAEWLQNYVQKMPNFAVLMFVEFAIGKWGTRALQCDFPNEIFVYYTSRAGVIESIQEEHLVIIGHFNSEEDFRIKFMRTIQDYNDYLYNSTSV